MTMNLIDHRRLNLAAALAAAALIPDAISPLTQAKDLFRNHGLKTAQQYAIAHRVYPHFAAWHGNRRSQSHPPKSRGLTVRDARQLEFVLTGETSDSD